MTYKEEQVPIKVTVVRKLIDVYRLHRYEVERRVSRLGIHQGQHRTLLLLSQVDQAPSQRELANALGISPAAVTTMLKSLEKEGYVSRSMTDEDNRRNEVSITEAGLCKIDESRAIFDNVDDAAFAGFSDEEMTLLIGMLDRIIDNLSAASDGEEPGDEA